MSSPVLYWSVGERGSPFRIETTRRNEALLSTVTLSCHGLRCTCSDGEICDLAKFDDARYLVFSLSFAAPSLRRNAGLIRPAKKQARLSLLNVPLYEGPKGRKCRGWSWFCGIMNGPVDPALGFRNVDVLKQHGRLQMATNSSQNVPIKGNFNNRPLTLGDPHPLFRRVLDASLKEPSKKKDATLSCKLAVLSLVPHSCSAPLTPRVSLPPQSLTVQLASIPSHD
ncbi:hypothetical protein BGZ57DRAFT_849550 [Hyaloscypha finlandica]|nr:hypothetical protein BGZ57DRAFT_849550 [Hyaloscypha finlandica]